MIYFTSDLHLGHNKDFLYKVRGFNSIEEHDETIVKNINSIVSDEDELYILGDLILNNQEKGLKLLKQINGQKTVILGNHDTSHKIELYKSLGIRCVYAEFVKYHKYRFILSHYPMKLFINWDRPVKDNLWCLCGHMHTSDKFIDMDTGSYHVELDAHNNKPISIEEVIEDLKKYKEKLLPIKASLTNNK